MTDHNRNLTARKTAGTVALFTLACVLMASPASALCRGRGGGTHADKFGGVRAGATHCSAALAGFAVRNVASSDLATSHFRGWNGGRWHRCHRHWIGMADYYGVPWAYSDFFDGDTACTDGGWGDALVYEAALQIAYAPGDLSYCARTYRSYDPASSTYLGHDRLRHPCP